MIALAFAALDHFKFRLRGSIDIHRRKSRKRHQPPPIPANFYTAYLYCLIMKIMNREQMPTQPTYLQPEIQSIQLRLYKYINYLI